uniref:Uncharacterized protein n=1 Tax=Clytia hemisphaerica TaxID=252671 RepID=A0A7M5XM89_9CNID
MSGKQSSAKGLGKLSGFRQVYEHAITNHHKTVLYWIGKEIKTVVPQKKTDLIMTEFYKDTSGKKTSLQPCYHIWDKELVDRYKDKNSIHTKSTQTLFNEKKIWKNCATIQGHEKCFDYSNWKLKHLQEFRDLCEESAKSSKVVFVPGKTQTPIKTDGSLKSLDPPCLLVSEPFGKHPYTCNNCESHKGYLIALLNTGVRKAALLLSEPRIGRQGFRKDYATKTETKEHLNKLETENKELKKTIKKMKRTNFEKKSWENILFESCDDNDITKLAVDMVSLFQQHDAKNSIQFEVCRNLIGKLKSKNNHRYVDIVKDIGSNLINHLGQHEYSLFQNIFGLPGKTCANDHVKTSNLKIGLNDFFETAEMIYEGGPVIDSTDEARILRYISPVLNEEGKIELVGESFDPDCDLWGNCNVLLENIISDPSFPDEFSALKSHVDSVIDSNKLSKDAAVHNFSALSGVYSKPLVYLVWPTPNKGYQGKHLLKIWDVVRSKCFFDETTGNLKNNPVKLVGHATDSAGFQLAAAVSLMSPNPELLKLKVKYLTLGIGATKFAAPYLGPLPSISYLDYDHCLRLFLKCLKYQTLDLDLFPSSSSSYRASIDHLKELKEFCDESGYKLGFSNNDLLFSVYFDQNVDAALKIFKESVADQLEINIVGSKGTVLYIRAVIALFKPFLEPSSNPLDMQCSISKGITVLRIWKKIIQLKDKRVHAVRSAATDPSKRGKFVTYGCNQTAEILFAAATYHMLAMFSHFKDLTPSVLSPFKSGTKTTERLISDLQGKTNALQSLDAQPVLSDLVNKLSKVQSNHTTEDRLKGAGATKQNTTSRRRLQDKLAQVTMSPYKYPATYDEFCKSLIAAYEKGKSEGIELYRKFCPEGIAFIESNAKSKDFAFLCFDEKVPEENQFKGFVDEEYSLKMLRDIKPAEYLSKKTNEKEKKI